MTVLELDDSEWQTGMPFSKIKKAKKRKKTIFICQNMSKEIIFNRVQHNSKVMNSSTVSTTQTAQKVM